MSRLVVAGIALIVAVAAVGLFILLRLRGYREATLERRPLSPVPVLLEEAATLPAWQVLAATSTSAGTELIRLSLDGKRRIVFTDRDEPFRIVQLARATSDGWALVVLRPTRGPSETQLAFVSTEGTATVKVLLGNFSATEAPVPSPDGRRIAYVVRSDVEPDRGYFLLVMNTDGSNRRRLFGGAQPLESPAFSPDGSAVAFVVAGEAGSSLLTVPADGSAPATVVAEFPGELVYDLFWGKDLVFGKRPRREEAANEGEIYRLDGLGRQSRLTDNAVFDGEPVLSPDGRLLALLRGSYPSGKITSGAELRLTVLDLTNKAEKELVQADAIVGFDVAEGE